MASPRGFESEFSKHDDTRSSPKQPDRENVVVQEDAGNGGLGPHEIVRSALARAIELAAEAGEWATVRALAEALGKLGA